MTLILALKCKDGVILASDGQATGISSGGPIRQRCKKIHKIAENVLLAASGSVGVIQRCRDAIRELARLIPKGGLDTPIPIKDKRSEGKMIDIFLRDKIRDVILRINKVEIERYKTFHGERKGPLPLADIILVFYDPKERRFRIWHVGPDGGEEFLDELGYGCSGIGDTFAHAYLKNFYDEGINVEMGKLIAYRVIKEAIEVGAYGLGEPIDIWVLKEENGKITTYELSEDELMGLEDSYHTWKEGERKIFKNLWSST